MLSAISSGPWFHCAFWKRSYYFLSWHNATRKDFCRRRISVLEGGCDLVTLCDTYWRYRAGEAHATIGFQLLVAFWYLRLSDCMMLLLLHVVLKKDPSVIGAFADRCSRARGEVE